MTSPARGTAPAAPALPDVDLLRHAFEALPQPCLILRADGMIADANGAAEQFFNTSRTRLRARNARDVFGRETPTTALLDLHHTTGLSVIEHALHLRRGDGRWVEAALALAPLDPSGTGAARGSVLTLHEWTQARLLRRRLRFRSAARSLSGLSRLLTRGVRNPLAAIRGAAQLLEADLPGPERELATLIRDESDRITALLDGVSAFDMGPPESRPVNLHRVMEQARDACAQQARARGITITETYDPSLPPARGDRDRLVVAVIELLRNAIDAATARVHLGTAFRHGIGLAPRGAARTELPLEISVRDDGPGVESGLIAHLFAPFATSRAETGAEDAHQGMGLARVARIVDDHAGLIDVLTGEDAPEGGGTLVTIHLPAHDGGAG